MGYELLIFAGQSYFDEIIVVFFLKANFLLLISSEVNHFNGGGLDMTFD